MGMMDPVPLATLGQAMKDTAWLDMRILEYGNVPRVRVQSILVTPSNDIVELYQEYGEEDYRHLEVDSEDIMAALPSCFERADVPEPVDPIPADPGFREDRYGRRYELKPEAKALFPIIRRAVFDQFSAPTDAMEKQWLDPNEGLYSFSTYVRYALLILLYELTELPKDDVYRTIGYHSPQPMLSAYQFIDQESRAMKKDKRLTEIITEAHKAIVRLAGKRLVAAKRHDAKFHV